MEGACAAGLDFFVVGTVWQRSQSATWRSQTPNKRTHRPVRPLCTEESQNDCDRFPFSHMAPSDDPWLASAARARRAPLLESLPDDCLLSLAALLMRFHLPSCMRLSQTCSGLHNKLHETRQQACARRLQWEAQGDCHISSLGRTVQFHIDIEPVEAGENDGRQTDVCSTVRDALPKSRTRKSPY